MGITVGVVAEIAPGERRVAMTPGALAVFKKTGIELLMEPGAGVPAGFLDSEYAEKGVRIAAGREEVFGAAEVILQVRALGRQSGDRSHGPGALPQRPDRHRIRGAAHGPQFRAPACRRGRRLPGHGTDAAHHPGAKHGRAFLHGHHRRLQSRPHRGRYAAAHVPHADDRRGHHHARARAGDWRGRRRPSGHRHRAAAGRGGERLRYPRRGQGADREPGRALRGAGYGKRRRRRQGRLRQSHGRGFLPPPARAVGRRAGRAERGHHHRRRARKESAGPDHRAKWWSAWRPAR